MQLNNLVIIPIPNLSALNNANNNNNSTLSFQSAQSQLSSNIFPTLTSPIKSHSQQYIPTTTNNNKDDIIQWKKSISAFKKFKSSKRDNNNSNNKQSKTNTNTNNNKNNNNMNMNEKHSLLLLFQQYNNPMDDYQRNMLINKRFTLAKSDYYSDMNRMMVGQQQQQLYNNNNKNEQNIIFDKTIKIQQQLKQQQQHMQQQTLQQSYDYYDPSMAPFFQYGVSYRYLQKDNKITKVDGVVMGRNGIVIEGDSSNNIPMRRMQSSHSAGRQRRQYTRKQANSNNVSTNTKSRSQNYLKITHNNNSNKNTIRPTKQHIQNLPMIKRQQYQQPIIQQQLQHNMNLSNNMRYCSSQSVLPQYNNNKNALRYYNTITNRYYEQLQYNDDDPFIIIKSIKTQEQYPIQQQQYNNKRGQLLLSSSVMINQTVVNNSNNNISNRQNINKPLTTIKKHPTTIITQSQQHNNTKLSQSSRLSNNSYNNNSSNYNMSDQQQQQQQQQLLQGYGNTELQMIEFDLFKHINPQMQQIKQQLIIKNSNIDNNTNMNTLINNNIDSNLAIFQLRDQHQTKRQLYNISQQNKRKNIIKQYTFCDNLNNNNKSQLSQQ